jgi:hypothetical protein
MKPHFIHIGDRILNLATVLLIEVEGPNLLNVYLMPNKELIQYANEEAHALLAILKTGYMTHVQTEAEAAVARV